MSERKIVRKWFWVWEFEKEEQWLNTMAQSGWLLQKVGFCRYEFIPCEPGEYTVRLEMHACDPDYVGFMAETGARYIGQMAQWAYFCKKTADGDFDIFSDLDSRIAHLNGIGRMLTVIGFANLLVGFSVSFAVTHFGWINLLCATLLMYALGRIHGQAEALQKERALRE